MKKVLFVAVVMAALAFQFSCKRKGSGPSANENIDVYSFADTGVQTTDEAEKMVEKFLGITDTGPLYKSDENTVYFTSKDDVTTTFEEDLDTGNFTFHKGIQKYMGEYVPKLPGKQAAIKATEDFLRTNGLFPKDNGQLKLVHFGGIRSNTVIDGNKPGPVTDKLITVTYGRVVDGLPVIGPGSKLVANIGEGGELVGLVYRWRELDTQSKRKVGRDAMLSQQEAEEMARRQIQQEYGQGTSYKILGSGKAYYDNNGKILQPVYVFETEIKLKDEKVKPFNYLCVIQMLRQSPEPLQLTAVDPRAKELIKTIRQGEQVPTAPEKAPDD
jgi:hypothetical protein